MPKYEKVLIKGEKKYFFRFSIHQRLQHIVLFTSVILLALTGFPLRHPDEAWSRPLYDFMGGTEYAPLIHRMTGSILLILFVYHTIYWMVLFYKERLKPLINEGRLNLWTGLKAMLSMEMVPNMKDVSHWGVMTIGTGLGNARFTNRTD